MHVRISKKAYHVSHARAIVVPDALRGGIPAAYPSRPNRNPAHATARSRHRSPRLPSPQRGKEQIISPGEILIRGNRIAVDGDSLADISAVTRVKMVMRNGVIYKNQTKGTQP